MPDNLTKRAPNDSERISLSEEWELKYWSKSLGCSREELKQAVSKVGNSAKAVKEYFHR